MLAPPKLQAAPPVTATAWSFVCAEPERRDYRTLSPAFLEGIPAWLENPKMYAISSASDSPRQLETALLPDPAVGRWTNGEAGLATPNANGGWRYLMEYGCAACLAPVMLEGVDYDKHSWAAQMQGWLTSLPGDSRLPAGAFCELMREAFEADRAGMYLKSLSILSRAERLLADCDALDSFVYAMGGAPRRIPTDPGGGPRNTQPGPTGGGGTSSGNPCDSMDDDTCSQCIGGLCLYSILNAICGGGCS